MSQFEYLAVCVAILISIALAQLVPEEVTAWGDHFRSVRRRFFAATALLYAILAVNQFALESLPVLDVRRLPPLLLLTGALMGLSSERRRVQTRSSASTSSSSRS